MSKESDFVDLLNKEMYELKIADLEAKLAESEEKVKHWHDLYNERDKQFQSVRQRYHLLNKLQSNYDKKDKLHLAYMQCLELVEENEKLKQYLAEKDKEIEYYKKQAKKLNNEAQKYFEDAYCNDSIYQDKISFAVDILEELADCSNYINSKLDFESGSYVSEKSIRDKIKYLKGNKYE